MASGQPIFAIAGVERIGRRAEATLQLFDDLQHRTETGDYAIIEEIAEAEIINPPYVSRVLRMRLLAPEIVEAMLAGRQPPRLTMARVIQPFPMKWRNQTFR